jgi:hypothetical protein
VLAATPGQGLTLNWPVSPGRAYGVQYKDDLDDPTWHDLQGNLTQGSLQITNAVLDHRFYRIYMGTNTP